MMDIIISDVEENFFGVDRTAESAAYISYHSLQWQLPSLLLFNATFLNVIGNFVKIYNKKIKLHTISRTMSDNNFVDDTEQYILLVNDISDIRLTLEALKLQKFNPNSKFIISCYDDECEKTDITQLLWNYRIVNVVYIIYENSTINTYTYVSSPDCDHPATQKLNLEDCIQSYNDIEERCTTAALFPMKLLNFHRCPLYVTTFEMKPYMQFKDGEPSGTDGDLLKITVDALNATLVIMTPNDNMGWGILVNNTWKGVLGDIQKNLANFSITSALMNLQRYQHFDMSMSYNTLTLVWLLPPLVLEPSSLKLLKPFTKDAWYFIAVTFIIFVLSHCVFDHKAWRIFSKRYKLDKFSHYFFVYTVQITLGVSVTKYPVNFCKKLIVYWIWYWFLIRTYYQVNLIYFLQTDFKVNNINDIQDALDQNYQFVSGKAIKDYYTNTSISASWKSVDVTQIYPSLEKLSKGEKMAFGTNSVTAKVFERSTHVKLHTLPRKILESYCVAYFTKNSSVTRPINAVFYRLFEAGISSKIFRDYTAVLPESSDSPHMPITLNHFTGCFGLLLLGWVLSSITFILEHLNVYFNKKHKFN